MAIVDRRERDGGEARKTLEVMWMPEGQGRIGPDNIQYVGGDFFVYDFGLCQGGAKISLSMAFCQECSVGLNTTDSIERSRAQRVNLRGVTVLQEVYVIS